MAYQTIFDIVIYRVEGTQSLKSMFIFLVSFKQLIDSKKQGDKE